MKEVNLKKGEVETKNEVTHTGVNMNDYESRLSQIISRVNRVEVKLLEKADDVVSIQLYQHRRELDDLTKKMDDMQHHLKVIEDQLAQLTPPSDVENETKVDTPRKHWFVGLFGT